MNICVIGLGSMGKRRIRLLLEKDSELTITGIDNNDERVKNVSEQYHIPCYLSLDHTDKKFDCAFVCTSPLSHGKIIRECLNRDCHIFSEINLIDDLYEENMCLAKEKNKVLFLSSTPIYRSEMQYISEKVRKNGNPCVYQYHVGQYLPDWHPWDNLKDFFVSNRQTNGCREYLAIELPWMQMAFGKITGVNVIKQKLTQLELDFPDTYLIQLTHENGNRGNLLVDVVSRQSVRHLEVINEDIYIRWDGKPDSLYEKDIQTGELIQVLTGKYVHMPGYAEWINETSYADEINMFFDVIEGVKPIYDFAKDLETLKIIDEIEG
mgnify:CR=1 FL=1